MLLIISISLSFSVMAVYLFAFSKVMFILRGLFQYMILCQIPMLLHVVIDFYYLIVNVILVKWSYSILEAYFTCVPAICLLLIQKGVKSDGLTSLPSLPFLISFLYCYSLLPVFLVIPISDNLEYNQNPFGNKKDMYNTF